MVRSCAVKGCVSGRKYALKKSFFKVPKKVESLQKWSAAIGQELKPTQYICGLHFNNNDIIEEMRIPLKDGKVYVHYYGHRHLKPDAVPCLNIAAELENENSVFSSDVKNESGNEESFVANNHSQFSNTIPDTSLLEQLSFEEVDVKEIQRFSINNIVEELEIKPLPRNWSWMIDHKQCIFLTHLNNFKVQSHIKIDKNLTVSIINAYTDKTMDYGGNMSSIEDVWQLLKIVENSNFCSGTGYDEKRFSTNCIGILSPDEEYKRTQTHLRCLGCRKVRNNIRKVRNNIKKTK